MIKLIMMADTSKEEVEGHNDPLLHASLVVVVYGELLIHISFSNTKKKALWSCYVVGVKRTSLGGDLTSST